MYITDFVVIIIVIIMAIPNLDAVVCFSVSSVPCYIIISIDVTTYVYAC